MKYRRLFEPSHSGIASLKDTLLDNGRNEGCDLNHRWRVRAQSRPWRLGVHPYDMVSTSLNEQSGVSPDPTTNNRMEIQAAIEGLNQLLKQPCKVLLVTRQHLSAQRD